MSVSNLTKPRFVVSFCDANENDKLVVWNYAPQDLETAVRVFTRVLEQSDPAAIFLKINDAGYVRRVYYPEQLLVMRQTDETLRDGWREFTGRVHSQAAEAAINAIERQVEFGPTPQADLPGMWDRSYFEGGQDYESESSRTIKKLMAKDCEYCSGSGCQFCHVK